MIKLWKKLWLLISAFIIIDFVVITMALVKSGYEITTPGGLNEVADLIEVDTKTTYTGSFNTIFVQSFDEATVLQKLFADLSNSIEVSKIEPETVYEDYTLMEKYEAGMIQKNQSIEAAIICAYRTLSQENSAVKIDYKFKGYVVRAYFKEQKVLRLNDLIIGCTKNGQRVDIDNPSELANYINTIEVGNQIHYLRAGKEYTYEITEEIKGFNRFYCYAKYEINTDETSPKYKIHIGNTLGPSGGLLQTLSVYAQVSGIDLTKGRKIAGTGTISVDGRVGAIGGIRQKIVTAINNDVDIFICPKYHEEEAREAYQEFIGKSAMKIYFVDTFNEALEVLR